MLKQVKIDKNVATLKCDKICKKVLKMYSGKEKNNHSKNCSKQIDCHELNCTVCLALLSVLL